MAVIDSFRGILTVFVEYSTSAENASALLKELQTFHQEFASGAPGFISNNFHLSLDQKTIYNYSQWKSENEFDTFWADENVKKASGKFSSEVVKIAKTKVVLAA